MAALPREVRLIDHPVVAHMVSDAREANTPPAMFRELLKRIGQLLAYEATRDLKTTPTSVTTPLETFESPRLAEAVTIVPILRAGMGLTAGMMDVIPNARMGHLGMFRDEEKLKPVSYYEKLPEAITSGPVLLVDPMLATGGSAVAALELLQDKGCKDIRFVCLVAAPEGLAAVTEAFPGLPIYTAAVDRELNDIGYILPGLGDAGDRVFGTLEGA